MYGLSEYLTEYVSSGRRYNGFPSEPDKEKILDWLSMNAFEELENENFVKGGSDLSEYYDTTGRKCFIRGPFEDSSTSWFMIHDHKNIYMVRVNKKSVDLRSTSGNLIKFNGRGRVEEVSYTELKEEIERNA